MVGREGRVGVSMGSPWGYAAKALLPSGVHSGAPTYLGWVVEWCHYVYGLAWWCRSSKSMWAPPPWRYVSSLTYLAYSLRIL